MNAAELRTKIAEIYTCVDGPPRAMFELPHSPDDEAPLRVIYQTVAIAMRGEPELVEGVLCDWAWAKLHELISPEMRADHWVVLFWRSHPVTAEFTDAQGRTCTRLKMRLAIPGVDLGGLVKREEDEVAWL